MCAVHRPSSVTRRRIAEENFLVDALHEVLNFLRTVQNGINVSVAKDDECRNGFYSERPRRLWIIADIESADDAVLLHAARQIVNGLKRRPAGRTARLPKFDDDGRIGRFDCAPKLVKRKRMGVLNFLHWVETQFSEIELHVRYVDEPGRSLQLAPTRNIRHSSGYREVPHLELKTIRSASHSTRD